MVTYTNEHNLPPILVNALTHDKYEKVGYISASGLTKPIQLSMLEQRHDHEIVIDAADNFWLLLGNALHHYLAMEAFTVKDAVVEQRLVDVFNVDGEDLVVSGQSDLFFGDIDDYKVTKAYIFIYGMREEWIQQQNVYALLWEKAGFKVSGINIMAILRDWDQNKADKDKNYPQIPFMRMPVTLWHQQDTENWIKQRLSEFRTAETLGDHELPPCTDEERWIKETTYAVMKEGRKTAVRVLDTREECQKYMTDNNKRDGKHSIVKRKGGYARCKQYCNAKPFCHQLLREKEGV